MTTPKFDALAARLLEREQNRDAPPPSLDARARAVRAVEQAIRRRARRRIVTRVGLAAAAAAVVVGVSAFRLGHRDANVVAHAGPPAAPAAVTVVGHPTGGGATVVETGAQAPLTDGRFLAPGSRILAQPDGHVVLAVSTGTRLTVEESGDLSIVDSGPNEIFMIRAGAVRADVAKLHTGQRFVIRTPDAEVEVRGTSFRVAAVDADPTCAGGSVTRVEVYEGVVSVRQGGEESRVAAGQSWPGDCASSEHPATSVTRRPRAAAAARAGSSAVSSNDEGRGEAPSEQLTSDLREQNDAFARAFAAKRRGASREALEAFDAFIARFPTSSLVENALVQRMRLLGDADPARGAIAARQYLSRYPKGFARTEAEARARRTP